MSTLLKRMRDAMIDGETKWVRVHPVLGSNTYAEFIKIAERDYGADGKAPFLIMFMGHNIRLKSGDPDYVGAEVIVEG